MLRSLKLMAIAAAALSAAVSFALAQTAPPAQAPILTNTARFLPVVAKNGMVASQEKLATHVGVDILKAGFVALVLAVALFVISQFYSATSIAIAAGLATLIAYGLMLQRMRLLRLSGVAPSL